MIAVREEKRASPGVRSFRDPAGAVVRHDGRILRLVRPENALELDRFLATECARNAIENGLLVRSARVETPDGIALEATDDISYEHERVPFPSYPHEWPAEMLASAGELTLKLFQSAIHEGFGLKDATPYNVLFRGATPVFVDVLSFEQRNPFDATWISYAQFVRTFLLPLLSHRYFGLEPGDMFAQRRDGLEPDAVYRWAGLGKRFAPDFLSLVTLPKWLGGKATEEAYRPKLLESAEKAHFVLEHLLASSARKLRSLASGDRCTSTWTGYLDHKSLYSADQFAQKEAFVEEALDLAKPKTVLDVGANEGHFSFLAADRGSSVIAIDTDPRVVGTIWREASRRKLDVLPLVVDLTRPTPSIGWRNQECDSFLDRVHAIDSGGGVDMVMMLAVIHHMLVTERVPLAELLSLVAELTQGYALIEFVAPQDPMFGKITRGREALHADLTTAVFEAAAKRHFEIVRSRSIEGLHRCLYLLRRCAPSHSKSGPT